MGLANCQRTLTLAGPSRTYGMGGEKSRYMTKRSIRFTRLEVSATERIQGQRPAALARDPGLFSGGLRVLPAG
jgi:hypothetical protein